MDSTSRSQCRQWARGPADHTSQHQPITPAISPYQQISPTISLYQQPAPPQQQHPTPIPNGQNLVFAMAPPPARLSPAWSNLSLQQPTNGEPIDHEAAELEAAERFALLAKDRGRGFTGEPRGRPPGSKNKPKVPDDGLPKLPKKLGRPPGSKNKSKVARVPRTVLKKLIPSRIPTAAADVGAGGPSTPFDYAPSTDLPGQWGNDAGHYQAAGKQYFPSSQEEEAARRGRTVEELISTVVADFTPTARPAPPEDIMQPMVQHNSLLTPSPYANGGQQGQWTSDNGYQYQEPPQAHDNVFLFGKGNGRDFTFGENDNSNTSPPSKPPPRSQVYPSPRSQDYPPPLSQDYPTYQYMEVFPPSDGMDGYRQLDHSAQAPAPAPTGLRPDHNASITLAGAPDDNNNHLPAQDEQLVPIDPTLLNAPPQQISPSLPSAYLGPDTAQSSLQPFGQYDTNANAGTFNFTGDSATADLDLGPRANAHDDNDPFNFNGDSATADMDLGPRADAGMPPAPATCDDGMNFFDFDAAAE